MKLKLFLISFFLTLLLGCATTNQKGFSISNGSFNQNGIAPVYSNDERAYCLVPETFEPAEFIYMMPVFLEKSNNETKYFYVGSYSERTNGYSVEISIPTDAERFYITIDEIMPKLEAESQYNTIFCGLGGTSGSGNIMARSQIKQEELILGKRVREQPLSYWKEKYPDIYKILISKVKYWERYNDDVKVWLSKIAKEENLEGYENLYEYLKTYDPSQKAKVIPRGEDAWPFLGVTAYNLYNSGKITYDGLVKVLEYSQLGHGSKVFLFLVEKNMSAEEFCYGVDDGTIYLTIR